MDHRTCARRSGEQPTNKGGIRSGSASHDRLKTCRGSLRHRGCPRPSGSRAPLNLLSSVPRCVRLARHSAAICDLRWPNTLLKWRRCNPCGRCAMFARRGHGPKALRCNRHGARSFVASIQIMGSRRSSAHCKISGVPPRPWAGAPSHMVSTTSDRSRVSNPAAT